MENWRTKTGLTQINEAQKAGARIKDAFVSSTADGAWVGDGQPLWRTLGPGEWLANAWAEAGKPFIEGAIWEAALRHGNELAMSASGV